MPERAEYRIPGSAPRHQPVIRAPYFAGAGEADDGTPVLAMTCAACGEERRPESLEGEDVAADAEIAIRFGWRLLALRGGGEITLCGGCVEALGEPLAG